MPWTSNVPYVERSVKRARRSFTGTRSSTVKLGPLSNSGATRSVARSTGGCSKPDWAPAITTVVDTTSAIASPLIESVGFNQRARDGARRVDHGGDGGGPVGLRAAARASGHGSRGAGVAQGTQFHRGRPRPREGPPRPLHAPLDVRHVRRPRHSHAPRPGA